jgi:hypothetical protein
MGIFDLFKSGGPKKEKGGKKASPAAKWAEKAGDKRAQNYDRQEALQALAEMGTADAAQALLKRFTFYMEPSITDQEEKDLAYRGVLRAGKEALDPVRAFAAKAESVAWPMKIAKELLTEEEYVDELVAWLAKWDTDYAKFVDPKVQLLVALEEFKSPKIREAVEPFLLDVHEPARFHAVMTTFAQANAESLPALLSTLVDEESLRVRSKIADGLVAAGWEIPEKEREAVRKSLPSGYTIDGEGHVKKRG